MSHSSNMTRIQQARKEKLLILKPKVYTAIALENRYFLLGTLPHRKPGKASALVSGQASAP